MAVYLKERMPPVAKKGSLKEVRLVTIRDAPLSEHELKAMAQGDPRAGKEGPRRVHRAGETGCHGHPDRIAAHCHSPKALLRRDGDLRGPARGQGHPRELREGRPHQEKGHRGTAGAPHRRATRFGEDHPRPVHRHVPFGPRPRGEDHGGPAGPPGPRPYHPVHLPRGLNAVDGRRAHAGEAGLRHLRRAPGRTRTSRPLRT